MELKADLHIHSRYSFDSRSEVQDIARIALRRGLDIVAVTDHGTLEGALRLRDYVEKQNLELRVIMGCELTTEVGDVLGLFIEREPVSRWALDLVDEISEMGGMSVFAHPYREYDPDSELVQKVDAIEIYNTRSSKTQNYLSQVLALRCHKTGLSGSDAHRPAEVGSVHTLIGDVSEFRTTPLDCFDILNGCMGVRLNKK